MKDNSLDVFPPSSIIGIMGGGQLGRMTALAAANLGYRCHIYTEETDSPAAQVSATTTVASYKDHDALTQFAKSVDLITYEFENIPMSSITLLISERCSWSKIEVQHWTNNLLFVSSIDDIFDHSSPAHVFSMC